ncbi:MAG: hypothetical protein ACOX8E_02005 [Ruminococcus sp.]|jgi:hypothetical protein
MHSDYNQETDTQKMKAEYADISESCRRHLTEFEQKLEKEGYRNIALVAYQIKHS